MLGSIWGGTFHSVANRLLRTYGEAIGLDPNFTVMDQSDAEDLMDISRYNHALGSKEKRFPRKQTCLSIYSRCVNSSDRLDHIRWRRAIRSWCARCISHSASFHRTRWKQAPDVGKYLGSAPFDHAAD
jgi:superfamily I DNA/RNA helicase